MPLAYKWEFFSLSSPSQITFFVVDGIDYVATRNQLQTFCKYLIKM